MGMTEEGNSYQVLTESDMKALEEIGARIVNARGRQFIYNTQAGVKVTFDPFYEEENTNAQESN